MPQLRKGVEGEHQLHAEDAHKGPIRHRSGVAGLINVHNDSLRLVERPRPPTIDDAKEREAAKAAYWNENSIVCAKDLEATYVAGWLAHARASTNGGS